jgi:GNAT superfamily N-acetyltransferase
MNLRLANPEDKNTIWEILQAAIEQRRKDGSEQWQNGYPNEQTVITDIQNGHGYVLVDNQAIIAYAAIIFGIEPTYTDIQGQWLSNGDYAVVHRVAIAEAHKRKGMGANLFLLIEELCVEKNIFSIKVDTNFDNVPMLRILDKLNYTYCGEIFFSGASRKAYEKLLIQTT